MGPAKGTTSSGFTSLMSRPTALNFPVRFAVGDLCHLLGRIVIADRMPGGAGHLRGHYVQAPPALQGRAAGLAHRQPGIVAMEQGCAPGVDQNS